MVLSILTELGKYHLDQIAEYFHHPKRRPITHYMSFPIFTCLLTHSLKATNVLPISMTLPILNISYKWNHRRCDFCVWLLSQSRIFSRFFHVLTCIRISFLFYCRIIAEFYCQLNAGYILSLLLYSEFSSL